MRAAIWEKAAREGVEDEGDLNVDTSEAAFWRGVADTPETRVALEARIDRARQNRREGKGIPIEVVHANMLAHLDALREAETAASA